MTNLKTTLILLSGLLLISASGHADDNVFYSRPLSNAAQVLQGTDPSLDVSLRSGSPFSEYNMILRGVSSVYGSSPLVLVDGMEYSLSNVNPYDIESVTILKDASAAAIYGSRASGGVILVKTKNGTSLQKKPVIDVDLNAGTAFSTQTAEKLSEKYCRTPRISQVYNASVKGGTESVHYYFGGRYFNQQGNFNETCGKNGYENWSLTGNFDARIVKFIKYRLNASYSYRNDYQPFWNSEEMLYTWLCSEDAPDCYTSLSNPYTYRQTTGNNFLLNNALDFSLARGLTLTLSYDISSTLNFQRSRSVGAEDVSAEISPDRYIEGRRNVKKSKIGADLSYTVAFANGMGLDARAGVEYLGDSMKIFTNSVDNLLTPAISALTAGDGNFTVYERKYSMDRLGAYAGLDFRVTKGLEIGGTFRYDNSSRFAPAVKDVFSYSGKAGWDIAREDFMKGSSRWLNTLKVRASYADIANQSLPVSFPCYTSEGILGDLNSWVMRLNGSKCYAGSEAVPSDGLLCEKVSTADVGLDLAFFGNRLSFSTDFFVRKTTDMLVSRTVYVEEEADVVYGSTGVLNTQGLEISLGWNDSFKLASEDFTYNLVAKFADYNTTANISLYGLPRFNYSFAATFNWAGADLSLLMHGVGRQQWDQLSNLQWDTYFAKDIQDCGFFRLKNVSLGYTFRPKSFVSGIRVGVNGENLFYASPFKKVSSAIDPQMLFSPASVIQYQRSVLLNLKLIF